MIRRPPRSTLFPTRRSSDLLSVSAAGAQFGPPGYELNLLYLACLAALVLGGSGPLAIDGLVRRRGRSEEHTSELQSLAYLVCRLLLEKKKTHKTICGSVRYL